MKNLFEFITRYPRSTLILLILFTLAFGSQLPKLRMETDAESMIPQGHPAIRYNDKAEELFDIKDAIIIGIVNETSDGIFNPETLALVQRLTIQLADLEGIAAVADDDVVSLSTIDNIIGTEFGFEVSPFMEEVLTEKSEIEALRNKIFDNGIYVGGIVSNDGTTTAIYAELEAGLENRAKVYRQVETLVTEEMNNGGSEKIYIAGRPVLEVMFGDYMAADMQKMFPLVIVVVIGVLFVIFRSLAGVLLPFSVVIGSVIWSMGIMAIFNVPMFTISTQIPVILMAVGTAYGIHILNKYFQEKERKTGKDNRALVLATMQEMWKPVVMTALTTAVGFASLITAYMVPIRWFGVFTSVGVLAAMVFSLIMIPACLIVFKIKVRKSKKNISVVEQTIAESFSGRILCRLGQVVFDSNKTVILATIAMGLVAFAGLFRISTNSSWIEAIKHDSPVYIANRVLNEKLDGTLNLYMILDGQIGDAVKSPQLLQKIDALQQKMEQMPLVGGSRSIAEYIKRMNRVMNEDRPEFETVPDTRDLVAQYLLMYSMSGDPGDFDDVVDYDYQQANIWLQIKSDYTDDIADVVRQVEEFVDVHLAKDNAKVNLAGQAYISYVWVDLLVRGQMNSILFSILAVFMITAVMFRSVVAGFFNIIPISAAMLLNFGIMGLLGYPLDVSTALSSGIVIGVGIDYTIHFLSKYHLEMQQQKKNRRKATVMTMITTGRAIFFNALAVIAGFMVLYTSNFPANGQLGGLVSVNMLTCFIAAVTILPALLNAIKPKFISRTNKEG